jgi:hypothetical protein
MATGLRARLNNLEHGKLRLGTDSFGEVRIEWDDISRIESDFAFQFERTDGTRVTGTINKTPEQRTITLTNQEETVAFAHENVVRIAQIEDTFWDRIQGSLSFGYSYTKASNVAQGNLGFRATHRTEIWSFSLDGSTIITSDQENEGTQRTNLDFSMTRFRANRWFSSYLLGLESDAIHISVGEAFWNQSVVAGLHRLLRACASSSRFWQNHMPR